MKKRESKTAEWTRVRKQLVIEFATMGVTRCEFRLPKCTPRIFLGFLHCVKRRFLRKDAPDGHPENIKTVAVGCSSCHQQVERLPKPEMRAAVMKVIKERQSK